MVNWEELPRRGPLRGTFTLQGEKCKLQDPSLSRAPFKALRLLSISLTLCSFLKESSPVSGFQKTLTFPCLHGIMKAHNRGFSSSQQDQRSHDWGRVWRKTAEGLGQKVQKPRVIERQRGKSIWGTEGSAAWSSGRESVRCEGMRSCEPCGSFWRHRTKGSREPPMCLELEMGGTWQSGLCLFRDHCGLGGQPSEGRWEIRRAVTGYYGQGMKVKTGLWVEKGGVGNTEDLGANRPTN